MLTANKRNKILDEYFPNLDNKIKDKLNEYYELIETENSKYNLTGFHDEILFKYGIIENILIFQEIEKKITNLDNLNILDIGAGAGFPSLPFLIFKNESFNLTIYEAQKKRCSFLQLVIDKLNIKNINIVNIRCENSTDYSKFDFITARAVSEFKNLVEISHKLGKMNSYFCFLKSKKYNLEIDNAK
jgi:16S rRNA methyltransferase gidB